MPLNPDTLPTIPALIAALGLCIILVIQQRRANR